MRIHRRPGGGGSTWTTVPRVGAFLAAGLAVVLVASGCVLQGTWHDVAFATRPGGERPPIWNVSCPTVDFCMAAGVDEGDDPGFTDNELMVQVLDGGTWSPVAGELRLPEGWDGWQASAAEVGCWSSTGCLVSAGVFAAPEVYAASVQRWDGSTWTDTGYPGWWAENLECPAADSCTAYDEYSPGKIRRWDGSTWSLAHDPSLDISAGSCGEDWCVVVETFWEGPPRALHIVGDEVVAHPLPFPMVRLHCLSPDVCHAVDTTQRRLAEWDGVAWVERTLLQPDPAYLVFIRDVDCSAANACVAVGGRQPVAGGPTRPVVLGWWGEDAWARVAPQASWSTSTSTYPHQVDCIERANRCTVLAWRSWSVTDAVFSVYDWP